MKKNKSNQEDELKISFLEMLLPLLIIFMIWGMYLIGKIFKYVPH